VFIVVIPQICPFTIKLTHGFNS